MSRKGFLAASLAALGLALLLAAPLLQAAETPKRGGILRVASETEPPTLDPHLTTAAITLFSVDHWMESPFNQGSKYEIIPELVDTYQASDDLKTWALTFRKGVLFHNGKEMTAEDVHASMKRWGAKHTQGQILFRNVESFEIADKYTVRLKLKIGSAVVPSFLIHTTHCFIYPKEVIAEAGDGSIKQNIGTGPFVFVEHKPDRYIKVKRFDKYSARPDPPNGYGGKKTAYLDEIHFIPVPEQAQRYNLLVGGEVDFSEQVLVDNYPALKANPQIDTVISKSWWIIGVMNKKQGLLTNLKLRQAIQAAFDMEPILMNVVGNKDFYRLDPNLVYAETIWETNTGIEFFNQKNPAKAKQLMKEAGYKGEPIRWMASTEKAYKYGSAVIAAQQLRDVGFNIDLQVMDWAVLVQLRNKPEGYDMFTTGLSMVSDPSAMIHATCGWPGWSCFPELDQLMDKLATQAKHEDRFETFKKIQHFYYANAVNIKFGDFFILRAMSKKLKGYQNMEWPVFWNTRLAE